MVGLRIKEKFMKKTLVSSVAAMLLVSAAGCGGTEVKVTDYTFDTAGNMFAYAEFELSGEPLAESLGLDLDVLDAGKIDSPTPFDYIAGIESYEYSEEAMYELVEKSGMGLHLLHGPVYAKLAAESGKQPNEELVARFGKLAEAVRVPLEDLHKNMFPTLIEYDKGDPHYPQQVDTDKYAAGEDGAYVPIFQVDFASLRWDRSKMSRTLTPAAYGGAFLKQALWAGDFLGNMHTVDKDEEIEPKTPADDMDSNIGLGVSSKDGLQGVVLTEEIWNKLLFIRNGLFYDPSAGKLTEGQGASYKPEKGLVYLPHAIQVEENGDTMAPNAKALKVTDARSLLQDQWLTLWPAAEFYGMTDQREANPNTNPALRAVFDGAPFPAAPQANTDSDSGNDVRADDPYSVNRDVLLQVFRNVKAMHWNEKEGVFVTEHDGKRQGGMMDTFHSGYTIEALRIFQRAIDGLPVGYANGEEAEGLKTEEGAVALDMIKRQADFLIANVIDDKELAANGWEVGSGKDASAPTLKAQLGAVRGLTAAFLAMKDTKYRDAARKVWAAMDSTFWNEGKKAYQTTKGEYKYDVFTAGALSGGLRMGLTALANTGEDKEKPEALNKEKIQSRYVDLYRKVINGTGVNHGMQASEFWDTGDFYKENDKSGNTDKDSVPQIQAGHGKNGIAPILLPVEIH